MKNGLLVGIQEKPKKLGQWITLSLQHVFAMFGATVLVPLLTGLDVGVALVSSGIGTLIYILCTKGKVPVYLGSSFAYIAAIVIATLNTANSLAVGMDFSAVQGSFENIKEGVVNFTSIFGTETTYGVMNAIKDGYFSFGQAYSSAFVGLMIVGLIYVVVSTIIRFVGNGWIKKLLPPVIVGPMIIIIGLSLAPTAIQSAGLDGTKGVIVPLVAGITFFTTVIISIFGKGFVKIVPFIFAVVIGYLFAVVFGIVDVKAAFADATFFKIPEFTFIGSYRIDWSAALLFAPIAFVTIAEHIGDHTVLGEICDKDFITNEPGLQNTILGDGIATFVAGALGGPANTTYGENTGVVAMTRVGSVYVTGLAAIFAILLGFLGWIQAFIMSIPWAVIGGMTIVLYGLIAGNGVKVLIKAKLNLGNMKNLIIVATMLVIGLGGAVIKFGSVNLTGMSLAALFGIILNFILPEPKESE